MSRSCSLDISDWQTATLEVKPDWKRMDASACLNSANCFSSSVCMDMVPMMVRTAAEPTPYFSMASMAAFFTLGLLARAR